MLKFLRRKKQAPPAASASVKPNVASKPAQTLSPETDTPLKDRLQSVGANKGNELVTLLNIGTTKKMLAGEYLFREGEPADTGYIVLDGAIEELVISDENETSLGVYPEKSWINFLDLSGTAHRVTTARAKETSSVLLLDERLLNSIDDDVLLFIYRELHKSSVEEAVRKEAEKAAFAAQSQGLVDAIFDIRTAAKDRSKNSDLAQNVIQKVPKLPIATIGLLNKLTDDSTSTNEVVDLVKSDPSLTSVLLKTLNSAEYSFEEKIADVNHAVSLLGYIGVYQIVMSQSLRQSLPDTPAFRKVYTRSLEISHIAFAISQASGVGKPAEMATIGLVHSLGNIIVELLRQQNPKLENLIECFDVSVIGAQLLHTWNLPEGIWKAVEHQDSPEFTPAKNIPEDILTATAVLYVAQLCHQRLHKVSEARLPMLFLDDYLSQLNWKGLTLGNVLGEKVAPNLRKKAKALPASLALLLG
ncbi:hypothetical protein A9Q88_01180 [Gammaproteobacteria bacterium 50_400_T64]|nr:hypothetical protein A9Q88_01180 [Gammaproteobacteria bacterium 50_400_T64]